RPLGGDPGFHVGRRADRVPCRDLDGATGPVGTLTTCLLVIGVGEAGLVRHAVVLVAVHCGLHVPSAGTGRSGAWTDTEEQRRFGQVDGERRIAALNAQHGLDGRGGAERNARAATGLVPYRRHVVVAAHIAPIERGRRADGRRRGGCARGGKLIALLQTRFGRTR